MYNAQKYGGPGILKSKLRFALAKMNRDKAAGSDGIIIDMLLALDNIRVDKITEIINV